MPRCNQRRQAPSIAAPKPQPLPPTATITKSTKAKPRKKSASTTKWHRKPGSNGYGEFINFTLKSVYDAADDPEFRYIPKCRAEDNMIKFIEAINLRRRFPNSINRLSLEAVANKAYDILMKRADGRKNKEKLYSTLMDKEVFHSFEQAILVAKGCVSERQPSVAPTHTVATMPKTKLASNKLEMLPKMQSTKVRTTKVDQVPTLPSKFILKVKLLDDVKPAEGPVKPMRTPGSILMHMNKGPQAKIQVKQETFVKPEPLSPTQPQCDDILLFSSEEIDEVMAML